MLFFVFAACGLLPEEPPAPSCEPREAFYPDVDGDGLGEPTDVYIGCQAPDGWVSTDDDTAFLDTSDTGGSGIAR